MSGDTAPTMPGLVHFLRPREGTAAEVPPDCTLIYPPPDSFPPWNTFQPEPSGEELLRAILVQLTRIADALERLAP